MTLLRGEIPEWAIPYGWAGYGVPYGSDRGYGDGPALYGDGADGGSCPLGPNYGDCRVWGGGFGHSVGLVGFCSVGWADGSGGYGDVDNGIGNGWGEPFKTGMR